MADNENRRERDMILAPNEYAFISDETKGDVSVFVGPNKTSLAGTDRCVTFDERTKRFKQSDLGNGVQTMKTAPEGWYVVLKNPAEADKHPTGQGKLSTPSLRVGKKVNIAGPCSFALWPGQMAKVVQGHNLRSNEYLLVRVYDEEAAKANWGKQVIKTVSETSDAAGEAEDKKRANKRNEAEDKRKAEARAAEVIRTEDLTMGKMFVIRGTEVSFYIPPTGIEVVPELVNNQERYVREAVTLERLEYCLLLDQSGQKRYEHGPAVVFPRPTEKFVEAPIKSDPDKAKAKKFRAQELTETSGIHVRVIADYTDTATGKAHHVGEELFITGKEQKIYFPREEHAIIKYGEQDIHYGIAIPTGEARYVLNRETGSIRLVLGPSIFLPDPRKEVIVARALPLALCEMMYPGNAEAISVNAERLGNENQDIYGSGGGDASFNLHTNSGYNDSAISAAVTPDTSRRVMIRGASKSLPGDSFNRRNKFTAPRTIVLNTKYDGAVTMDIYTGFAVKLVRKDGTSRVVVGPKTVMLEYDEAPQVLTFSRGKPKGKAEPVRTVYLKVTNNRVGDVVEVETSDCAKLNIEVSYRLNFTGEDPSKWFDVDNYVNFLCDNMRSRIRSAVRKKTVQEFYFNSESILRDIILGTPGKDGEKRTGTKFDENNLHVYDAEILNVQILNKDVEQLLTETRRQELRQNIALTSAARDLAFTKQTEDITRERVTAQFETRTKVLDLEKSEVELKHRNVLVTTENEAALAAAKAERDLANAKAQLLVATEQAARQRVVDAPVLERLKVEAQIAADRIHAETSAVSERANAITPQLIQAITTASESYSSAEIAKALGPLKIFGINSEEGGVGAILGKLLEGTALGSRLQLAAAGDKPAAAKPATNGNRA